MSESDILAVTGSCTLAVAAVHSVTFAIGRKLGRYNVVDVAWGIGFVVVAAVAAAVGNGDPTRRWLLLAINTTSGVPTEGGANSENRSVRVTLCRMWGRQRAPGPESDRHMTTDKSQNAQVRTSHIHPSEVCPTM